MTRMGRMAAAGRWFRGAAILALCCVVLPGMMPAGKAAENDDAGFQLKSLNVRSWVGKPWPLVERVDVGPKLLHGRWVVLLHSPDCGHCGPTLDDYAGLAETWHAQAHPFGLASIAVRADPDEPALPPDPARREFPACALMGNLLAPAGTFIVSPTLLLLVEGRVVEVFEGVTECAWSARLEKLLLGGGLPGTRK